MLAADSLGTDSQCRHACRTATIQNRFLANGSTERQTKWRHIGNYSEAVPGQWQHAAWYRKTDKMAACLKLFRAASWPKATCGLMQKTDKMEACLKLFWSCSWPMAAQKDRQNGGLSEIIQKLFLATRSTPRDTKTANTHTIATENPLFLSCRCGCSLCPNWFTGADYQDGRCASGAPSRLLKAAADGSDTTYSSK